MLLDSLSPAELVLVIEDGAKDLAARVSARLRASIRAGIRDWMKSHDPASFDALTADWQEFVAETVQPMLAGAYQLGRLVTMTAAAVPEELIGLGAGGGFHQEAKLWAERSSQRWMGLGQDVASQMPGMLSEAIVEGHGPRTLASQITERFGLGEDAAMTMSRTDLMSAFTNGDRASVQNLTGADRPIKHVWQATNDNRTRPDHRAADQQERPFDEPFDVGGVAMMHPHAPGAPSEQTVNCRCVELYLYEGDRPGGPAVGRALDPAEVMGDYDGSLYRKQRRDPDPMLLHVAEKQGFTGLPQVVDPASLDGLINQGSTEMFRGVPREFAEDFRAGRYYPGTGGYGSGTYVATGPTALEVASMTPGNEVMRLTLSRTARIIDYEDALRLSTEASAATSGAEATFLNDPGRWAASQGYDAIRVRMIPPAGFPRLVARVDYVILNRTAVIVQDVSFEAKPALHQLTQLGKLPRDDSEWHYFYARPDSSKITIDDLFTGGIPQSRITLMKDIDPAMSRLGRQHDGYVIVRVPANTPMDSYDGFQPLKDGRVEYYGPKNAQGERTGIPAKNVLRTVRTVEVEPKRFMWEHELADLAQRDPGNLVRTTVPDKYKPWFEVKSFDPRTRFIEDREVQANYDGHSYEAWRYGKPVDDINNYLRHKRGVGAFGIDDQISVMDAGMRPLSNPTKLYREVGADAFSPDDFAPGSVFVDKGFASTGGDFNQIRGYGGKNAVHIEIDVPAGHKVMVLEQYFTDTKNYRGTNEMIEIVLDRNTRYEVVSYDPELRQLKVRVIGYEPSDL